MDDQTIPAIPQNPVDQSSPHTPHTMWVWYLLGAVLLVAALAFWYLSTTNAYDASSYDTQSSTVGTQSSAPQENAAASVSNEDDANADLVTELSQTSDDSAALNQDAAASAEVVGGF